MESIDFIILEDLDSTPNGKSLIVMTDYMYYSIIESINLNYLLLIFTIGCFSSLICYAKNENKYKLIENSNPVKAEVIEMPV